MPPASSVPSDQTVAVVGLGKIGLPLAAQFASKGLHVIGCDVLSSVVDAVNSGRSHIREEAGLEEAVAAAVASGNLRATSDTSGAVAKADVIVVIVPLMLGIDGGIDFRNLDSATRAVAKGFRRGSMAIYETTLPVGTTRHRVARLLEEGSGLKAGADFNLAFSPERLYSGRIFQDLRRYPKIVGGIDDASTERAVAFYEKVLDAEVWPVDSAETAEFTKLAETTYRDVNIALANELALYGASRGVNVAQAFKSANSQPFSHLHRPGIGVGGHCIPVYPHFLLGDATDGELGLVRDGRATNDGMARRSVDALATALGGLKGRRILVLGASYRENVKELAFSTAAPIIRELNRGGAHALVHDPLFEPGELKSLGAEVIDLGEDTRVDAVIVQAFHSQYSDLDWKRFQGLKVVFDGRGAVDPQRIREIGATYMAVGAGEGRATT